jgi:deoxycytidylate deaminase
MQITIKYNDSTSLTKEEVVHAAINNYGKYAVVEVMPDSTNAHDLISFGIQQIITHEQLSLLYEKNSNYNKAIKTIRAEVLNKLQELLDAVIIDNESKVSE